MDREEGVGAIVRPGKKLPQLKVLELPPQPRMFRRDLGFAGAPLRGVLRFDGELLQHLEIIDLALELEAGIDQPAQPRDLLDIGLGALAVIPKIGRRHALFEFAQLLL